MLGLLTFLNGSLRNPKLSAHAKLVGALMASHAGSSRIAWPDVGLLMREGNLRKEAVEWERADLVKAGFLTKLFTRDARANFAVFDTRSPKRFCLAVGRKNRERLYPAMDFSAQKNNQKKGEQ